MICKHLYWRTIFDVQKRNSDKMLKLTINQFSSKDLFEFGLINIRDLYENDNHMFSYNQLKNRLNLKTNSVQYICLTKALQKYVKLLNKLLTKHYNIDLRVVETCATFLY